jgi:hypothetical protein
MRLWCLECVVTIVGLVSLGARVDISVEGL